MPTIQKFQLPLITGFRSTNLTNAFVLNAFVTALITIFAIELRDLFRNEKSRVYGYVNNLYGGKSLSIFQILSIVFLSTFAGAILVYLFMYVLFDYGGGLLSQDGKMVF